jgi:hypothetical protein
MPEVEAFGALRLQIAHVISLFPDEGAVPVGGAEIHIDRPDAIAVEGEKVGVAEFLSV